MSSLLFQITAASNWKQLKKAVSWNHFHLCDSLTHICWRYLQLLSKLVRSLWQTTMFPCSIVPFLINLTCIHITYFSCYRFPSVVISVYYPLLLSAICYMQQHLYLKVIFCLHTHVCCCGDPLRSTVIYFTTVAQLFVVSTDCPLIQWCFSCHQF